MKKIDPQEFSEIEETYGKLTPLCSNIRTKIKIVHADEPSCKRGQEYCILFYSEKNDNYLQNKCRFCKTGVGKTRGNQKDK